MGEIYQLFFFTNKFIEMKIWYNAKKATTKPPLFVSTCEPNSPWGKDHIDATGTFQVSHQSNLYRPWLEIGVVSW